VPGRPEASYQRRIVLVASDGTIPSTARPSGAKALQRISPSLASVTGFATVPVRAAKAMDCSTVL
jgi:hypothetical protein